GVVGIGITIVAAVLVGTATGALSHALAVTSRSQEALIGASQAIILPMTFLSTAFMAPQLMPDWIRTVAGYNPLSRAVDASRRALDPAGDAAAVLLRLGWLALFAIVAGLVALGAFPGLRRSV